MSCGSLLCPEMDWNIRIEKQGYVFILTDFKRDVFIGFIPDINNLISVSTVVLRLEKVEFFK